MPIRVLCHQCKAVLYEDLELVSPKEVLEKNNGRCPKCSATMSFDANSLRIYISDENKRGLMKIFQKKI
ncbi:MAG: hypothetical protein H5T33_02570 [Candidatus Methanosuratus sp.]|nr:hypothetical protein [Candidatus Methanosuratincola sp.]